MNDIKSIKSNLKKSD